MAGRTCSRSPQRLDLIVGDRPIDSFFLKASGVTFHTAMVSADDFGDDATTELTLHIDQTFVPADLPDSNSVDTRRLGVRVFHAFPRKPLNACARGTARVLQQPVRAPPMHAADRARSDGLG